MVSPPAILQHTALAQELDHNLGGEGEEACTNRNTSPSPPHHRLILNFLSYPDETKRPLSYGAESVVVGTILPLHCYQFLHQLVLLLLLLGLGGRGRGRVQGGPNGTPQGVLTGTGRAQPISVLYTSTNIHFGGNDLQDIAKMTWYSRGEGGSDIPWAVCRGHVEVGSWTWRCPRSEHAPCPSHDSTTCSRSPVHLPV